MATWGSKLNARATSRWMPTTQSKTLVSPSVRRSWPLWETSGGVRRFASIRVPLDEALVEAALDLSGRPFLHYDVEFPGEKILGDPPFDPQLVEEFWRAFTVAGRMTMHLTLIRGKNTHHIVEAGFKAVARALRDALRVEGSGVPSTKGSL